MKEIQLTQGRVALVDDEDYEYLSQWKWYAKNGRGDLFYAYRAIYNKGVQTLIKMHRLIMEAPSDMEVDHIDRNGLNNQKHNLRICTHHQNQYNKGAHEGGTSKYNGVCYMKGWYVAQISISGKRKFIGRFSSEIDAAIAYDKMARKIYGEFAYLNFN